MSKKSGTHPLAEHARLRPAGPALERRKRPRVTVKLPDSVVERARNAVSATPELTFAGLVERSLTTYLNNLERRRGSAFPRRKAPLRVGRPRRTR